MRGGVLGLALIAQVGMFGAAAAAQSISAEPGIPEKEGKQLRAFRVVGEPPRIDGRLDDEVWKQAEGFEDFVQTDPDNGAAPTERTVIRVAYDDRYLYLAAWCYSKNPADVTGGLGRRGTLPPSSDYIGFGIDTRHDH